MPMRRNLIPPERRIYIKPEDLSKLPRKIHVYRGVLGGLYIDREELKRYRSEIRDEGLLERIDSGEEDLEAAEEEKIDELFLEYMNDRLNESIAKSVVDKFILERLVPMVKKGKGSIGEMEKEIGSLNIFLSFCSEKGIKVDVNSEIVEVAKRIIEDDKFEVSVDNEGKRVIEEMVDVDGLSKFLDDFSGNVNSGEIFSDCWYGKNKIFEEIFSGIRKYVRNLALAWRLSRVFYLMMIRSTDEGNYEASRVIEEALSDVIDGNVRPEIGIEINSLTGEIKDRVRSDDVVEYVDVKSIVCWLLLNEIIRERGIANTGNKLYRGINSVEALLMYSEIAKKPNASKAVYVGNILASFTNSKDIAFEFSDKVIEVDSDSLKYIFGGYWNSVSNFKDEKEVVGVIDKDGVECKIMDRYGSVESVVKAIRGEEDLEECENAFYELCIAMRVNDSVIDKCMTKEEIKEKFSKLVDLVERLYDRLVKNGVEYKSVKFEMDEIKRTKIYKYVKGV